ncbi:High-light-induced protein, chloroplastic [Ananas comosus]|uniref:High-light-induced protein, chloroplastic n=1 Tax=Ananas comosus TaxID=4615 RepID=A0A199UHX7_ANACO|nr:High-light-induced protein, chloroplastic [Ananas comosus]
MATVSRLPSTIHQHQSLYYNRKRNSISLRRATTLRVRAAKLPAGIVAWYFRLEKQKKKKKKERSHNGSVEKDDSCLNLVQVEMPKVEPKLTEPFLGFTKTAEIWNSRAGMIGIIGTFIVELVFHKGILQMIGVDVGKGLDLPL